MRKLFAFSVGCIAFIFAGTSCVEHSLKETNSDKSPVVESYSKHDAARSGVALGGIGAGYVELRKDGKFHNWTIMNNYPLGTGPVFQIPQWPRDGWEENLQFFIVRYQVEGEDVKMKLLQINNSINEAGMESIDYYYPWLSRIENIEYAGRFPFVNMKFTDPEMPFDISMEAFSPFIPHDIKNSSLPGVYFNFTIESTTDKKVNVMLIASQRNLVGYDTQDKYFVTELKKGNGYKAFSQTAGGMKEDMSSYGTMGIASLSDETTYHLGWEHKHPYYERLLFENKFRNENDTEGRNHVDEKTNKKMANMGRSIKDQRCFSSLAITRDLSPGKSFRHSFIMTWHFPNAYGAHNAPGHNKTFEGDYIINKKITKNQGHYYDNFFSNTFEVADYMINKKNDLTKRTRQFISDYYASDVDQFILDQVNANLNTFITSSTLRKDMKFGIREGMTADKPWGPNITIDVSLYGSIAVMALFPELQKTSMRCHRDLQKPTGEINHGLGFDLDYTQNGTWGVYHRIDMPGNYIQLVLRDFFWTGEKAFLEEMWPSIKKAVDYVLNERDRDNDMMPDMEGIMCSYDNFPMYGLSSYIQSQWLCAMASAEKAAYLMDDEEAAKKYKEIFEKGSELMDKHLWNGNYYRLSKDYTGLCKDIENATTADNACLTDQVIGQWLAHLTNLGYLFKEENVKSALQSVMNRSFKEGFGLRNCSWPEHPDYFPIHESNLWVDQANTPWSGVELAFASFLLYEDMYDEALQVIKAVNDRYREAGLYWNHQEFGGHYYRPMSAWGIINGLLGMSINNGTYKFNPKIPKDNYTMFFAFNNGTAHYIEKGQNVEIKVLTGEMQCNELILQNSGLNENATVLINDNETEATVEKISNGVKIVFASSINIIQGKSLVVKGA